MAWTDIADFVLNDPFGKQSANKIKDNIIYVQETVLGNPADNGGKVTLSDLDGAFPAGTKMAFFQASAPTYWTKDTTHNDKFIRVVSGSGGGSGGSWGSLSHQHTVGTLQFKVAECYTSSSNGLYFYTSGGTATKVLDEQTEASGSGVTSVIDNGKFSDAATWYTKDGTGSVAAGTVTHGSSQHQYVDMIICTKD